MSTSTRTLASRVAAGAGALALTLAGLGGIAATAAADTSVGNINPDAKGTLNIHKLESGSMQGGPGTPNDATDKTGKGVADVVFTAYKITNLDLTTQAAWNGLDSLSIPANACGSNNATPSLTLPGGTAATFDTGKASDPTADNGDTTISDLSVAAYLVCETEAPATVAKKAAPFLVTIPFPNNKANNASTTQNGEWLYTIDVYPKNTVVLAPTKGVEVTANGLQTAAQLEFPVTVTVPSIAEGDQFTAFYVTDPLNAALTDGAVKSVKLDDVVDVNPDYYSVTTGQNLKVEFNEAGRAFLKGKADSKLVITFTATANSVTESGNIPNTAHLFVDTEGGDTPPDTPTNPVVSSWGNAVITKTDADNGKALAGATFQVYNSSDPLAETCDKSTATGEAISINGVDTFTSDANGQINLVGLFVDSKVGVAGQTEDEISPDNTTRCYVLVETAAPAGYTLPQGDAANTALKITAGTTTADNITIDNTKQNVPNLPLTGANGQLLMMLIGAALVLLAAGSVLVARNRQRAQG
ncbi:LPXTG-motif cell wall anchor domain-containing protein/fimbrial isopeptide formation D2 domain-containing protein [Actinomyces ruminicola]|uniref:LPXTG-motif cell wall anchor domain-containing protein/fimbrial isopeptide formation D2 domain-containing protein n=1 Tax=Actinomyces ruminicola TaxID=332524 RepID=A0A1H0B463_9ACTO|nr:SpaH/EbpB family LPXTG-anchored major pilin [Actinomyces ruminicola]SDN40450.1 LPXTG-motif cell wall anchor domain-containing protein/fimbrial isopeptide formation D2 domain-containing protein [Actinomyces ruminicola]